MEKNCQIQMFEAALGQKLSQMARKYSTELVRKIWKEIKITGGDETPFADGRLR